MIISFPVLISETVDKEIIPYLLKAIERRFALNYIPILQNIVKKEIESNLENVSPEGIIINGEGFNEKLLESDSGVGIQILTSDSTKINSDQPFFITLRVTTVERTTQDYIFGFKALALIATEALSIFEHEMDTSRYWIYRTARKFFGDSFIWDMTTWYKKIFDQAAPKSKEFQLQKVLFSEDQERIAVLSINDIDKTKFENEDPRYHPLASKNLEDSRWSSLYLDDSLNKRIYMWDQTMPKFSNIITYDMLYKNTLNVLPEEIDKAKQRNTSLFSKRAPMSWLTEKIFGKKI